MPRKKRKRPSGQGTIWQQGGNWWIRWREGGRRRTAKFPRQDLAERVLARIVAGIASDPFGVKAEPAESPPLAELAAKWIERRQHTHRSWRDDKNRWTKHLQPFFGHLRPAEVSHALIRRFIEAKLVGGLSSTSAGHCTRVLSTFLSDVVEQGYLPGNPVRGLPRATRRLIRNAHDPKQTPFIERQEDIARIYALLAEPFATMFAVGALAGLRPGEIIGLAWEDVDLGARRMLVQRQVRHGKVGPTKSGKPRLVPIIEPLAKVLAEWKLATGGAGQLFRPLNGRRQSRFITPDSMISALRPALKACGLSEAWTWYHCSRHTFGAQHVMGGGSLATLREILGHGSVQVTERYGHLRRDLFRPSDLLTMSVPMTRAGGEVVELASARAERGAAGHAVATEPVDDGQASEAN